MNKTLQQLITSKAEQVAHEAKKTHDSLMALAIAVEQGQPLTFEQGELLSEALIESLCREALAREAEDA